MHEMLNLKCVDSSHIFPLSSWVAMLNSWESKKENNPMKETPCWVSQFSQPFRLSSKNCQQGFSGRCCCPEGKEEKPKKGAFFTSLFYVTNYRQRQERETPPPQEKGENPSCACLPLLAVSYCRGRGEERFGGGSPSLHLPSYALRYVNYVQYSTNLLPSVTWNLFLVNILSTPFFLLSLIELRQNVSNFTDFIRVHSILHFDATVNIFLEW